MNIRSVLRPASHATTPVLLANDIGQKKARVQGVAGFIADFSKDFFMWYPDPGEITGVTTEYKHLHKFFSQNKANQRILMGDAGIPVPKTYIQPSVTGTVKYVKRPLRHQGSQDYTVVTGNAGLPAFTAGQEYLSELFPKKREYRLILVKGVPALVVRKKPKEGVTQDMPWGNQNATWQKIDVEDWVLRGDCLPKLLAFPVFKLAHIAAIDILYNAEHDPKFVVLEANTCPDLQVSSYRAAVVAAIQGIA